jgi:hypothetical protein
MTRAMMMSVLVMSFVMGLAGPAFAEMLQGTVSEILVDENELVLQRTDTGTTEEVKIKVDEKTQFSAGQTLADLQPGDSVTLEADKGMMGDWTAKQVRQVTPAGEEARQ